MLHGNPMAVATLELPENILQIAAGAIASEDKLVVRAYGVIPITEHFLRDSVKKVLHKLGRGELFTPVSMILKELTINAAKANFKRVIFAENKINGDDPADYERGMEIFRNAISRTMSQVYGRKAKKAFLSVETLIDFDADRLIIEVRNNLPMSKREDARVREKLKQAAEAASLEELMENFVDDTEGAGLGLILSLMTLKSLSIHPHALTIATDFEKETVARLEIPLSERYRPAYRQQAS